MRLDRLPPVILLLFISSTNCDSSSLYSVPLGELQGLVASKDLQRIRNVLKYEGGFTVTNLSAGYRTAVQQLKEQAPECLQTYRQQHMLGAHEMVFESFFTSLAETPEFHEDAIMC